MFGCCCRWLNIVWNKAQHPGAAGQAGGAGGALQMGSHVVLFGVKRAQNERKSWRRDGDPSWEMSKGTSLPHAMGVYTINPHRIPWQGVWLLFPAGAALSQGGIFHAGILALRVPAVEVWLQMGPGLVSRLPGELRCPFIQ